VSAQDLPLVVLASYLAGVCTALLAHRLRRRSWHRTETLSHWRCRNFHDRYHVAYSEQAPGARFCVRCGECVDVRDVDWDARAGCRSRDPSVPDMGD
jgi:ferredoxin